jgi:hypothetical protein
MAVEHRARMMGRSTASREVVTNRRVNFTGYVPSDKNRRQIQYESLLERDYIQLIEADFGIESYQEQPEPLTWTDGERTYSTTFDFSLLRKDGRKILVEVKPLSKVIKHDLAELYGFARSAAKKSGYAEFELWTDREIRAMPRLCNAELVVSETTNYDDQAHLLAMRSAFREHGGPMTIRELRVASNLGPFSYRTVIRLIAKGELRSVDPCAVLDDKAILVRASSSDLS